jgi:hypothetical protein
MRPSIENVQESEWNKVFDNLKTVLLDFGRVDAFGDGDFCLIDDNYGTPQHKIEVSPEFVVSDIFLAALQKVLVPMSLTWEVILVQTNSLGGDAWSVQVMQIKKFSTE